MLNISSEVLYYIVNKFHTDKQTVIFQSFGLLEAFNLKYYEDKYINLISKEDTIDDNEKMDKFIQFLEDDIREIITDHYITLTQEDIDLYTLNEIAQGILLLCSLEDYTLVNYILSGDNTPRDKFIALMAKYTLLTEYTLYETIIEVSDALIESLEKFSTDKSKNQDPNYIETKYLNTLQEFFKFIDNTDCIGLRLYSSGYIGLTFDEVLRLIPLDFSLYLEPIILSSKAKASLEILSLLMLGIDSYELPLLQLQKYTPILIHDTTIITTITTIITDMLTDFKTHLDVVNQTKQQQEQDHAHQASVLKISSTNN